jgi:hypothetical protein
MSYNLKIKLNAKTRLDKKNNKADRNVKDKMGKTIPTTVTDPASLYKEF